MFTALQTRVGTQPTSSLVSFLLLSPCLWLQPIATQPWQEVGHIPRCQAFAFRLAGKSKWESLSSLLLPSLLWSHCPHLPGTISGAPSSMKPLLPYLPQLGLLFSLLPGPPPSSLSLFSPQKEPVSMLYATVHSKRVFADVIKDLEMGRLSGWAQCNPKGY